MRIYVALMDLMARKQGLKRPSSNCHLPHTQRERAVQHSNHDAEAPPSLSGQTMRGRAAMTHGWLAGDRPVKRDERQVTKQAFFMPRLRVVEWKDETSKNSVTKKLVLAVRAVRQWRRQVGHYMLGRLQSEVCNLLD